MTTGSGLFINPGEQGIHRIVDILRQLIEGRSNAVGSVTLTANAATSTVTANACGPNSAVFLFPQTANAAAALATTYIAPATVTPRQFIITHANNSQTDKTFYYVCLG